MNTKEIYIALDCPENLPNEILNDLTNEFANCNFPFEIRRVPFSAYCSLEWAIPTLIVA